MSLCQILSFVETPRLEVVPRGLRYEIVPTGNDLQISCIVILGVSDNVSKVGNDLQVSYFMGWRVREAC